MTKICELVSENHRFLEILLIESLTFQIRSILLCQGKSFHGLFKGSLLYLSFRGKKKVVKDPSAVNNVSGKGIEKSNVSGSVLLKLKTQ
jgi:hypothetical protein